MNPQERLLESKIVADTFSLFSTTPSKVVTSRDFIAIGDPLMFIRPLSRFGLLVVALLLVAAPALAQKPSPAAAGTAITTPKEFFGFNIGDDYQEVNYTQAVAYWKKLATETDRMKLVDIGKTEMGKTEWMVIISAPENMQQLDHYRELNARLARAKGLDDAEAHKLAAEGKAVVWIDGGLHSEESVGFQQLVQTIYEMVSRSDPETMRLLHDVIGLYVPVNPDGVELVSNWYNRIATPAKRTMAPGLPTVYNKYIGHDDNRDSYMSNMQETINMNRVQFQEWFPEILYNHHQTGPAGAVIFMPPFRDPFNYNFDPLMPLNIEAVGTAMHMRLVERGMGGSAQRTGANYSTWWDGGVRTTAYFHNIIGLLTEIIGEPNPIKIPLIPAKQLPNGDWPLPIAPQTWHYSQSIAYELQNNRAVLDYASRNRENLIYNIYSMGRNQIKQGSEDSWTITPDRIAALEAARAKEKAASADKKAGAKPDLFNPPGLDPALYNTVLHDPAHRNPRGYIIPSDQPDFATATKFINVLIKNGIEIERASSGFSVNGKSYPAGSYVVMSAQAARPFILDMFEPQHYPNDLEYPGGPPVPPYDIAGWTVAIQMGVTFARELDGFSGPFQKLPFGELQPMPAYSVAGVAKPAGYVISHEINNAFIVTNRLIKAGASVYWMKTPQSVGGKDLGTGTIYVPAGSQVLSILTTAAKELGVAAHGVGSAPGGQALKLKPIRIGLFDEYGGSMPSGWARWMLEQYEFPFQLVFAPQVDAGKLRDKFDVLLFVDSNIGGDRWRRRHPAPTAAEIASVPAEWRARMGVLSTEKSVPALKAFVQAGGTLYTIGSATSLAEAVGLPITSALTEIGPDGKSQPLPKTKFYIPGSLIRVTLNNQDPIAYGMGSSVDTDFDHDPVFRTVPNRTSDPTVSGWFQGDQTLVSGWANGQAYLNGNAAIVSGRVGHGMVYAVGPEITFRAQPHASFKLLFNGLYAGTAAEVSPK